jgi:hypothetical protein
VSGVSKNKKVEVMIGFLKKIVKVILGRSVIVDIVPPIEFVGWKMATGTLPP